ncbi:MULTISPECIES: SMP-30/gluconolactonase/LRE family protein [Sphingopyxis]|uniref:SMP-30/gluconolactonase/LRE family protein n=1 Tax=Sphingopyxis TaxID=165697 RepID=UPI001C2C2667|nr:MULTISPECIES: SMP-30/gluconolactonase/LRE family protein [Sphingopyxis]QXF13667.1 SMP-30/gluconolactonase/LRE family protein [Sphingopyxis terrae subsp. terrae]
MVDLLLDAQALLGESPRWHAPEARLYWVDIDAHRIHRTDPATGATETMQLDQPVGCVAPRAGGGLVMGLKDGCALIDAWGEAPRPFGPAVLAGIAEQRFNDGCVDAAGRFWIGSVTRDKSNPGAMLFRLDPDGTLTPMLGGLLTSNGAAFSPDGRTFYHADTPTHALHAYAVDPATGALGDGRLFHQFEQGKGRPDGGTVDAEGCYWSALWDGWRVVRLSPAGEILQTVEMPVQRPSMIALGGADLCTAFVTSAGKDLSDDARAAQPHAGGLFTFRVDVPGIVQPCFGG